MAIIPDNHILNVKMKWINIVNVIIITSCYLSEATTLQLVVEVLASLKFKLSRHWNWPDVWHDDGSDSNWHLVQQKSKCKWHIWASTLHRSNYHHTVNQLYLHPCRSNSSHQYFPLSCIFQIRTALQATGSSSCFASHWDSPK